MACPIPCRRRRTRKRRHDCRFCCRPEGADALLQRPNCNSHRLGAAGRRPTRALNKCRLASAARAGACAKTRLCATCADTTTYASVALDNRSGRCNRGRRCDRHSLTARRARQPRRETAAWLAARAPCDGSVRARGNTSGDDGSLVKRSLGSVVVACGAVHALIRSPYWPAAIRLRSQPMAVPSPTQPACEVATSCSFCLRAVSAGAVRSVLADGEGCER